MSVIKKLASDTALYGISSILARVVAYFLVPLHTDVFTLPEELSVQVEVYAWAAMLNVVYALGMETTYFFFASKENSGGTTYSQSLTLVLVASLVFSGLIILFSGPIASYFGIPNFPEFITWMAILMIVDAFVAIPYARLRLEGNAKKFVGIRVVNILTNVGLNCYFLWFCKGISEGAFLGELRGYWLFNYNPSVGIGYIIFANLIASCVVLPLLYKELRTFHFIWDTSVIRPLWVYAWPLVVMSLSGNFNLMLDRIVLKAWLPVGFYPEHSSEAALGIYGQCYKLSIFMSLVVQSFRYAADPFFFANAEDKKSPPVFANVMKWFVIAGVLIWVFVSLNLDFLGGLFLKTPVYREGLHVVPILLLANLLLGIYANVSVWFKIKERTDFGYKLTFVGVAVTLAGNAILIPILGYAGCAITFLLSCVVMMLLSYFYGQKYFPVPYQIISGIGYLLAGGLLIVLDSFVKIANTWLSLGFHTTLFMLFLFGVLLIERQYLPEKVRNKLIIFR